MLEQKLLIVEDKVDEAIWAQHDAVKAGFKDIVVATNLEEAQRYLPNVQRVATDLFFPLGNVVDPARYIAEVLPLYERYLRSFKRIPDNPIARAIAQLVIRPENMSKEQFFEEQLVPLFFRGWKPGALEQARDGYFEIQNYSRYAKLEKYIAEVKDGKDLPSGIFLAREARRLGIPTHIVTSTNHHDHTFTPVQGLIGSLYVDNLVGGRKNWAEAMQYLKQSGEKIE